MHDIKQLKTVSFVLGTGLCCGQGCSGNNVMRGAGLCWEHGCAGDKVVLLDRVVLVTGLFWGQCYAGGRVVLRTGLCCGTGLCHWRSCHYSGTSSLTTLERKREEREKNAVNSGHLVL